MKIEWYADGQEGTMEDFDYPYEFSVPLDAECKTFEFKVTCTTQDGRQHMTKYERIGIE